MCSSIRLSCLLAALLLIMPAGLFAATYVVDTASQIMPNWTVQGTIEFDGTNYTDWNLVSDPPEDGPFSYGSFTYTPANSSLAGSSPFFTSTNLGAQNFALDAPGASPDGGFLWLRFADPLTGAALDETTVVPGGITNGSSDTRFELFIGTWHYTGLVGTMTELGAVSNEGITWGQLKLLFE